MFYLNGEVVNWKSYKESNVVDFTIEFKCIALLDTIKETMLIKKFMTELGMVSFIIDPIYLRYDKNKVID